MSSHTISEAGENLDELINHTTAGEGVVINRNGLPVAELHPVKSPSEGRPVTEADIEWLRQNRVGTIMPKADAATFVRKMRDEGDF